MYRNITINYKNVSFFQLLYELHVLYILNQVHFYKQDQEECLRRYGNYSRGPNCYQTNHWGAFHKHFQIKPKVKRDGGLIHGKDVGLHDSDYFLEVKATNIALLSTLLTRKVKRLTFLYEWTIFSIFAEYCYIYLTLINQTKNATFNLWIYHTRRRDLQCLNKEEKGESTLFDFFFWKMEHRNNVRHIIFNFWI